MLRGPDRSAVDFGSWCRRVGNQANDHLIRQVVFLFSGYIIGLVEDRGALGVCPLRIARECFR